MTFLLASISFLLPVVAGILWVPSFLPGGSGAFTDRAFRLCLGTGVGLGAASLVYFLLLSFSGEASRPRLFLFETVLFSSLAYLGMRFAKERTLEASPEPDSSVFTVPRWVLPALAALFFLLIAGVLLTEVFLTFDRPHGGWDAWAIWNLRARFLFRGGEYWRDAFSPLLSEIHPDYPLLLPGLVARGWTYLGKDAVSFPAVVAVFYTLCTIGMLASAIAVLRGSLQGILAGVALACTPIFLRHGASQYADVPFGYYMLATFALLHLAKSPENRRAMSLAGFTAGLACWTKNEGVILLGALAAGWFVHALVSSARGQEIRRAGWFVLGALPPLLALVYFKLALVPPNDMINEFDLAAVLGRIGESARYLEVGAAVAREAIFQLHLPLLAAYLLFSGVSIRKGEREAVFRLWGSLSLIFAAYFLVYVITSKPLAWHLGTSLSRLMTQLYPSLLFSFFLTAATVAIRAADHRQGIAGPESGKGVKEMPGRTKSRKRKK
ncbi:MAG: hypothetical protein IH610_07810 [Deltaproteobacteria bacterium]|nr:hypothetical protein [Deltaproteobacteria bacterium]